MNSETIGHYHLVRELGRGGMGIVYEAVEEPLSRRVALKVLPEFLAADPQFTRRFEREAKAAAALSHPNVVTILGVGEENGRFYIAMEYVEGRTLGQVIEQSAPLTVEQSLEVIRQAAAAIGAAHAKEIVHRDIKPDNLMVCNNGRVRVMDFGLAKALTSKTRITQSGAAIGTPLYMSPERCEGESASPSSDIYSLGVVLFEMLTGLAPFNGDTPLSVMHQIVTEPFPDVRRFNPNVPSAVSKIISRMTAREPADRYADIAELQHDISRDEQGILRGIDGGESTVIDLATPGENGVLNVDTHLEFDSEAREPSRLRLSRFALVYILGLGTLMLFGNLLRDDEIDPPVAGVSSVANASAPDAESASYREDPLVDVAEPHRGDSDSADRVSHSVGADVANTRLALAEQLRELAERHALEKEAVRVEREASEFGERAAQEVAEEVERTNVETEESVAIPVEQTEDDEAFADVIEPPLKEIVPQIETLASDDDGAFDVALSIPAAESRVFDGPRILIHADGTFEDRQTGLLWAREPYHSGVATTSGYVKRGVRSDLPDLEWKVPTVEQLIELRDLLYSPGPDDEIPGLPKGWYFGLETEAYESSTDWRVRINGKSKKVKKVFFVIKPPTMGENWVLPVAERR